MRDFQHRARETAALSDVDYYRRRAIQEQVAAQKAACPTARKLHDELAAMYRFRVSMLSNAWAEAGVGIALQRISRAPAPALA
jgi:hypothetical protein